MNPGNRAPAQTAIGRLREAMGVIRRAAAA